ncbi:MAG TPA: glutamine-hydrolyzing carbamoyl-phosphate synthase small subunit [Actinomycetota bacterium]|nr:glutamine-hydrolyzing carbamoyl-phosphate synthase small subunit [Actinomycetota bacterium]
MTRTPEALLALEDGSTFRGRSFGAAGEAFGEAVFNTAMTGYQEVITDPSYARQIVAMTSPHQGNYGTNGEDPESARVHAAGLVVREASRRASSWRAERSLHETLAEADVPGIDGIDTRALTLRLREHGAMRAAISTEDLDPGSLVERVRASEGMEGANLAAGVSTSEAYDAAVVVGPPSPDRGRTLHVAAYDFGIKTNILRQLATYGLETTVVPATTPATEILANGFHGVFLSNGPGDPAATTYGIRAVQDLLGRLPIFGICLGHQLLALALGGATYKMKFGHRGANQPVRNTTTGRVEITSHNHGFAVSPDGWTAAPDRSEATGRSRGRDPSHAERPSAMPPAERGTDPTPATQRSRFGAVELTHWNLNDGTLEGLRCAEVRAFGVQYHPEAAPGPHDSRYLFDGFRALMERA